MCLYNVHSPGEDPADPGRGCRGRYPCSIEVHQKNIYQNLEGNSSAPGRVVRGRLTFSSGPVHRRLGDRLGVHFTGLERVVLDDVRSENGRNIK